jgi:hypothetical protein
MNRYSMSMAIYAGENPGTHQIQNSIQIHISPTHAAPLEPAAWAHNMMQRIPVHLAQYREKNLDHVCQWTWFPSRVSQVARETEALATALGQPIVDAPELRRKLLSLLNTQDEQRLSDMADTTEAIVVAAILALIRKGKEHAYSHEIAAEFNRLREERSETARLSPERVGHVLKSLGLPTRKLSKTGNGLAFDKAVIAKIHELAAVYMVEDGPTGE